MAPTSGWKFRATSRRSRPAEGSHSAETGRHRARKSPTRLSRFLVRRLSSLTRSIWSVMRGSRQRRGLIARCSSGRSIHLGPTCVAPGRRMAKRTHALGASRQVRVRSLCRISRREVPDSSRAPCQPRFHRAIQHRLPGTKPDPSQSHSWAGWHPDCAQSPRITA